MPAGPKVVHSIKGRTNKNKKRKKPDGVFDSLGCEVGTSKELWEWRSLLMGERIIRDELNKNLSQRGRIKYRGAGLWT